MSLLRKSSTESIAFLYHSLDHFHLKHHNFKPIGTPFIWFRNTKWIKERDRKAVEEKVIAVCVFSV